MGEVQNMSAGFVLEFDDLGGLLENYSDYNYSEFELDENTLICKSASRDPRVSVAICAFYTLIFLMAIPGNILVGVVIGSRKQALSPSDVYLLHLAVADILLAVTLPFWATELVTGWVFGDAMCKLVSLVMEITFYSSILFLACISVDRYLVIVRAMEAKKENRRLCSLITCAFVWIAGGVLSLHSLFNEAYTPQGLEGIVCAEKHNPKNATRWRIATWLLRQILGFLLPLVVMLFCYIETVLRLLYTRGFQKQRAMRVIVAVVVAFLLCWMPYHLVVTVDMLMRFKLVPFDCDARSSVDVAVSGLLSLGLLHCCINPVLYAFIGEKFRRNLLLLLHKKKVLEHGSGSRISRSTSQTSDANSTLM